IISKAIVATICGCNSHNAQQQGNLNINCNPNCFELFGADVLIDDTLRPWLLEVNSSPALSLDTDLDYLVKVPLVADIIEMALPMDEWDFDKNMLSDLLDRYVLKKRPGSRDPQPPQSRKDLNEWIFQIFNEKNPLNQAKKQRSKNNFELLDLKNFDPPTL
ncbi:MAG: hypothetical protein EZS28_047507, partial [Streblomastix strix]